MHIRHIPSRLVGITLMLVLAACGSTPQPPRESTRAKPAESADLLLADAVRRQQGRFDAVQALPMVKAALDKAPDRPDIAWLYVQLCTRVAGCQPEPAEARLRRLDSGNAVAWLGALDRARRGNDVTAANEILEAMSRSERFDIYWNTLISRIAVLLSADTARQLGPTTPDLVTSSLNDTIGWLSALSIPMFQPLSDACIRERGSNPVLSQRCSAIADAMLRGDSYLAASLGLGIRESLAAPGSPQATAVARDVRRSRYQRDTAGQIIAIQENREKFSRELIKLMANLRREQDVFLAVIRWGQQPVEPPADWTPSGG